MKSLIGSPFWIWAILLFSLLFVALNMSLILFYNHERFSVAFLVTASSLIALGVTFLLRVKYRDERRKGEIAAKLLDEKNFMVAEKNLRESEARLQTVCSTVPAAIFVIQGDKMPFVNCAASEITGYSKEELRSMDFWHPIRPDYQELVRERGMARQAGKTVPNRYEIPIITKSGEERWVDYTGSLFEYGGKPAILGTAFDITQRRRMEVALEKKSGLQELIATISTHFINTPLEEINDGVNRALSEIGYLLRVCRSYVYLYSEDGTSVSNTHEWCAPGVEPQIDNLQEVPIDLFPWMHKKLMNLETIPIPSVAGLPPEASLDAKILVEQDIRSLVLIPMLSKGGTIGFVGLDSVRCERKWDDDTVSLLKIVGEIFVNALERRRADIKIQQSEEKFRTLAESTAATWIMKGTNIINVNSRAEELTGLSRDAMVESDLLQLIHTAHREQVKTKILSCRKIGSDFERFETRIVTKTGEERWVDFMAYPIAYGGARSVLGTAFDITQRKQAEEALNQRNRELLTLHEISQIALGTESVEEAANAILEKIAAATRFPAGMIGLCDESRQNLTIVAFKGISRSENADRLELPVSDLLVGDVIRTELPLVTSNVLDRQDHSDEILRKLQVQTFVSVPLLVEGRNIGALGIGHHEPILVDHRLVRWLESMANYIASLIERKRAEGRLHYQVDFEMLIANLSKHFLGPDPEDIDGGIDHALKLVGEFTGVDRSYLYRFCDDGKTMNNTNEWCADGIPRSREEFQTLRVDPPCWVLEKVLNLEVVHIRNTDDFPPEAIRDVKAFRARGLRSAVLVPLARAGKAIGFLSLVSFRTEKTWTEESITLLRIAGEIIENALERKRAEQALRDSEERYRALYDDNPSMYFTLHRDGTVLSVNRFGAEQLGYDVEELVGRSVFDLFYQEDREPVRSGFEEALQTPDSLSHWEFRKLHKDGRIVWVKETVRVVRGPDGQPNFFVACEDITEKKAAGEERERLEAQVQYNKKMESIGVLAGGIAHDFNSHLMSISGNADLALLDLSQDSPVRDYLEQIKSTVDAAGELSNQLLAYSGKSRIEIGGLNLSHIVRGLDRLLSVAVSKRALLQFDLAENLPALQGNATQIRQVVMNLITNASDALEEQTGVISVRTGVVDADRDYFAGAFLGENLGEGSYVYLEVSDTGPGIKEETSRKILDPFFTTKSEGRGLGLFVVSEIVKSHQGAIHVRSSPERGTTFRTLFPSTGEIITVEPQERTCKAALVHWRGNGRVLVIDDDDEVRLVSSRILEKAGFSVVSTSTGRKGIDTFRSSKEDFAAVLLDMTMADMSGVEAYQAIHQIRPDARVILTSGYSEQLSTGSYQKLSPAGFIQKPYHAEALIEMFREVVDS